MAPDGRALTSPGNGRKGGKPARVNVRGNAVKHGILASELVIEALGEDAAELDALRRRLVAELAPEGLIEELLVERILVAYWRLRRVVVAEGGLLTGLANQTADRLIARRRALGHAGDEAMAEDEAAAFAAAQLLGAADAERLGRYETGLLRQLYRATAELKDLQEARIRLHFMHGGERRGVPEGGAGGAAAPAGAD